MVSSQSASNQQTDVGDNKQSSQLKWYDLSSKTDRLWHTHRSSAFVDVAGALQEELGVLQEREKKIGALKASVLSLAGGGGVELTVGGGASDATSALTSTIK